MQRALNYAAMPPMGVPLSFLLTAPCFVLGAALLLAWHGELALVSRWTPVTLAITHLLTLGFLTMTIVGALFQLLPVVAGVVIPWARPVAAVAWGGLAGGCLLLSAALALGLEGAWFHAAATVLGGAGLVVLCAVGAAISRQVAPGALALVRGVRMASAGLAITIGLGGSLALYLGGAGVLDAPMLTDIHAFWGLIGWVVVLTVAVSFQVIPMFQGTSTYPRLLENWLPVALFAVLFGWSAARLMGATGWRLALELGVAAMLLAYAAVSLRFFRKRKRKADVGTAYWSLAMVCLVLAVLVHYLPVDADRRALLAGILVMLGFAMSAINGMLYKIVPFLVWYHLQADEALPRGRAPGVKQIVDEARALRQWRWHVVALGLAVAAPFAPAILARPAGLFLAFASALLMRDLGGAVLLYARLRRP